MYLEISSRQSGKTTRLLDAAEKWLQSTPSYCKVILVAYTKHYAEELRRKLIDRGLPADNIEIATAMPLLRSETNKRFIDEFDNIDEGKLCIDDNVYYCTTAKKKRNTSDNDFFMKLLNYNGGKYVSYLPRYSPGVSNRLKTALEYLGKEAADLEIYNNFIDYGK